MRVDKVKTLLKVLVLSQIRGSGGKVVRWRSGIRGVLEIGLLVFASSLLLVYSLLWLIPDDDIAYLRVFGLQILSSIPLITFALVVMYGVFFMIGDNAQYGSSEMINHMPISASEYVMASSLSTVVSYNYLIGGALGISLALAVRFGLLVAWLLSSLIAICYSIVGGFVSEILRSAVNRVSSSFSKRGGRTAILSRAVLIVLVLALSQILFNPNILFRILEVFAPQIQSLWFVPFAWPSIAVIYASQGAYAMALAYLLLTLTQGAALMAAGLYLRRKYWVPLPVTIKLASSSQKGHRRYHSLERIGFSQAESALVLKDLRSLVRRKEMVRYWAIPFVILLPLFFTMGSMSRSEMYAYLGMFSFMSVGFFGVFLSGTSIGQEGRAVWNLFARPLRPRSIFRAKVAIPLSLSLVLAVLFSVLFSVIFGISQRAASTLFVMNFIIAVLAVGVGSLFGAKYPELDEKPRGGYISGTGMFASMVVLGLSGLAAAFPIILYVTMSSGLESLGIGLYHMVSVSALVGGSLSLLFLSEAAIEFENFFSKTQV
ncbi:MAG: hypothetical protein QFX35_07440 [Candidatus Verstraetearchaeota archaeon]|nr:hypothetical protein [Candidatus Verstraetearchaeota archaeon]